MLISETKIMLCNTVYREESKNSWKKQNKKHCQEYVDRNFGCPFAQDNPNMCRTSKNNAKVVCWQRGFQNFMQLQWHKNCRNREGCQIWIKMDKKFPKIRSFPMKFGELTSLYNLTSKMIKSD